MDHESVKRLGLEYIRNLDVEASEEIYDPSTFNHTILVRLIKGEKVYCPKCGLANRFIIRGSKTQCFNHSSAIEDNLIIKLTRRVYKCECGAVFMEENPFTASKRKNTIQKEIIISTYIIIYITSLILATLGVVFSFISYFILILFNSWINDLKYSSPSIFWIKSR